MLCLLISCGETGKNRSNAAAEPGVSTANLPSITLFTTRYLPNDQQLLQQFKRIAGIEVNVVSGTAESLLTRLQNGESADVVLMTSIQDFYPVKAQTLSQPFFTEKTDKNVPSRNTDIEGHWLGLSRWAPVFIYNKELVDAATLQRYTDITQKRWRGKLATGDEQDASIQTIASALLAVAGEAAAKRWIGGLAANRLDTTFADDFDIIQAVAEGRAAVGIVRSSSLPILQRSGDPNNFKTAEAVGLVYPANEENITYHNLTVAGLLLKTADRASGLRLIEFLSGQTAQEPFAAAQYEFPVNPFAMPSDVLIEIGGYREGRLDLNTYGKNYEEVLALLTPMR